VISHDSYQNENTIEYLIIIESVSTSKYLTMNWLVHTFMRNITLSLCTWFIQRYNKWPLYDNLNFLEV
jgi:hypothetical protein